MSVFIHDPKNVKSVESLWAWLSVDEDGNEGICATMMAGNVCPLVTGDPDKVPMYQKLADSIAGYTSKRVVLAKFTREDS